jgi:hypothetical protein
MRREKVAGKIVVLDRALEDTLSYLFGLRSKLPKATTRPHL